ncbi:hypothetical protein [Castellaniella sp.]|uniref:hypothetical protein n=1 Tax=Castellaniella sp. TaxID=1955812 RepID=UPI00355FE0F2
MHEQARPDPVPGVNAPVVLALCPPGNVHYPFLAQQAAQVWPTVQALPSDWLAIASRADALVLLADVVSNCCVAGQLQAAGADVCLLAGMQHGHLGEYKALLRVGIACILPRDARPDWLGAVLAVQMSTRTRAASHAQMIDGWQLSENGWWLSHAGHQMRLSVPERALLQVLFAAPGHVAHVDILQQALRQAAQGARLRFADSASLRHQFSRLRARARQAHLGAPPIKALSDVGYVWV